MKDISGTRGIIFLLGSGAIGAILIIIVGLAMGWVVTSGRANASAIEMSDKAVQAQLSKICMHQFKADGASAENLVTIKSLNSWEKEKFVEEHGWATMPGSDSSFSGVARICATTLANEG